MLDQLAALHSSNKAHSLGAVAYRYICRYADDICNAPPDIQRTLKAIIPTMYRGALPLEDTANYHHYRHSGDINYAAPPINITFLDLLISIKQGIIMTDLYQKAKLFPFKAVGIDVLLSNTFTPSFASVFASESLRFYHACSHYQDFIKHAIAYMVQFIKKGYPRYLLTSSLLRVFKRHPNGK